MRRRARAAALALLVGLTAPATSASACPDPDEEPFVLLYADTLTVTFRAGRKTYRPGETARITVTVERRTPGGLAAEPVAAEVKGRLRTPAGAEPDRFAFTLPATGTKTKLWAIPRATRPGPLSIDATALSELLPSASCNSSLAYERGTATTPRFITITR